ncbi:MAG TPA: outer membrane lipoprotein-sorting protein [Alphaproteobacteria bacterium]|nr:outer membrane lipoprotein-sorting protein [Alphaproteobacteria bacterium]
MTRPLPIRPKRRATIAAITLSLGVLGAAVPGSVLAESAAAKGLAIAVEADKRDLGWGDSQAKLVMLLKNSQGQSAKRQMRMSQLEGSADGDKSMIVFDWPKDIDGTALLTWSHKTGDDDQWLFLPALRRVKRISSSNKSGSFVGSEFSYEDLSSQEVEKYKYKYLRDEACGTLQCFVIDRYPVDPRSGYTRQVAWIDKTEYRIQKIDYYDRKSSKLKTLTMSGYRKYQGKYWRAHLLVMVNHQSGKSTQLQWQAYKFRTGLKAGDFRRNALRRSR